MHQFQKMTLRICLGETAAPALNQQTRNHQRLGEEDGNGRDCHPAVLIPVARRAKAYLAVLRQVTLIDTKALEFTPVENRLYEAALDDGNVGLVALQTTRDTVSRVRADQTGACNKTSSAAKSNPGRHANRDWPIRFLCDDLERFRRII